MVRFGTNHGHLALSSAEHVQLEEWSRLSRSRSPLAKRARIILRAVAGRSDREIAAELEIGRQTVGKWRTRFSTERLPGLLDRPRSGAPRRIPDGAMQRAIDLIAWGKTPDGACWSTRSLSRATGLSQSTISRILRLHVNTWSRMQTSDSDD